MIKKDVRTKRLAFVGLVSLSTLILVFLFARFTQANPRPFFYLPPRGETMGYLAPRPGTAIDVPMTATDLRLNGVAVVYEFAELENLVSNGSNKVDAVIIHTTRLADVDQLWIRKLYRQGVVIAGVNISIRELGDFLDDDYVAGDPTWTDGWQKEPFFSILALKVTGTTEEQQRALSEGRLLGVAVRSTDNIRSASDAEVFLSLIRRDIWELRETETPPSTTH